MLALRPGRPPPLCGQIAAKPAQPGPTPIRRRAPPPAALSSPADAASPSSPPNSQALPSYTVRPATEADWWPVAGVHVEASAFFPNSGIFAPVLRLDRVVGLQVGYGNAKESESKSAVRGPFLCLVAAVEAEPPRPADPAPWWMPAAAWPAFSPDVAAAAGIAGAAVVDLQGGHVPPRTARARGTVRLAPRKGLAYVSNLAVAPSARRSGLGTALLAAAEAQAWAWGAHALALHVDARNEGAAGLYRRAGFRAVEPSPRPGMSGLGGLTGPSGQPLTLMLKVRPRRGQGVSLSPPPSTGVEESGGS